MLVEKQKVDFEFVCNVVSDMISGDNTKDWWYAFLQGMSSITNDDRIEDVWYLDCAYTKLLGNGITTSVVAGTPTDILDDNFREIVSYGTDNGYFDIDTILDHM